MPSALEARRPNMQTFTAKNLDEVLSNIAKEKGCEVGEIHYNIIEEKKGLLGFGNSVTVEAYIDNDIKEYIFDFLGQYFENIDLPTSVEIIQKADSFKVILDAEDHNALLIGHGGETLTGITNVLKSALSSNFKHRVRVSIDINHYKDDRYSKLKKMASRIAREVRNTHMSVSLDPMPNDERKVIHQFLNDFDHIRTQSEGEGNKRHLVIHYTEEETKESE